jgi:hypothetical protein
MKQNTPSFTLDSCGSMWLSLVMQSVSERASQWYSKCYSMVSVTKRLHLKTYKLWVHAHALNVRVDLEGPVAALDGMKNEANGVSRTRTECSWFTLKRPPLYWTEWRAKLFLPGGERAGSSWRPWRDADVLVLSWLVGWLRVVASRCGRFSLVHRLSSAAGSLTWRPGMSVSYTLPANRTRPNAARRCYAPRWLATRQDTRRLGVWGKTALWEVTTSPPRGVCCIGA